MATFSIPSTPRAQAVRRERQRRQALARLAQRRAAVQRTAARLGWQLGVLGSALALVFAVAGPAFGEARAFEPAAQMLASVLAPSEEAAGAYVVQPGDTLYSIARASGLSVDQLAAANGLPDPDVLKVGQVLLLDGNRTYMVQQASLDTPASYTVQSGDTLFGIAARYGISVPAIVAWNGLSDPHYIVAGAMLKLRSGGAPEVKETTLRSTAEWAGSPNYWPGRPNGEPIALVIHTMGGTLPGAMGEFANSFSGASAHFGIGLNGRIQQYVDLSDRAWANGVLESGNVWPGPAGISPNDLTISIETEDLGDPEQPVTEAQYEATLKISRLIVSRYPSIRYLLTHRAISPQTRPDDPGPRWVARGQLTALANALGLKLIA